MCFLSILIGMYHTTELFQTPHTPPILPSSPSRINFRRGMEARKSNETSSPENQKKMELKNKEKVDRLYEALQRGNTEAVAKSLASELECWFHGPRHCHHMMQRLSGKTAQEVGFQFEPQNIIAIGDCVIVDGWKGKSYWVHVWTIVDGLIVQFREYFNTWLVVKDVRPRKEESKRESSTLWKSQPRGHCQRSMPELVLAI